MKRDLKVLFLTSEIVPFAKTGGLADVAEALPEALNQLGVDVRVVIPYYRVVREASFGTETVIPELNIPFGTGELTAGVLETRTRGGVPVYLIDREDMYDRPGLYGNHGSDYYDNMERFTFYTRAALHASECLEFKPDVIHCHDWQTGLAPALLMGPYAPFPFYQDTATVFTIHNIGYQGVFPVEKLSLIGLSQTEFFHPDGLEYWGQISLLKAGINYSDAVTTVSRKYAREILTPQYGLGMEGVLKGREASLHGILNGVDYTYWNPAADKHLAATYSLTNLSGKKHCKESLLEEMGLRSSLRNRPLMCVVSRLDSQKGIDLLLDIVHEVLDLDTGLIILGSGDPVLEQAVSQAASQYPGRMSCKIGFDEPLAHRIIAGADISLIPSRYEPCGLTQIHALKYGTIPIVRATGGLDDTIIQYNAKTLSGNGFKFSDFKAAKFLAAIRKAVDLFTNTKSWETLRSNGMKADFSWEGPASEYLDLYRSLTGGQRTG
jgi:starch synthase